MGRIGKRKYIRQRIRRGTEMTRHELASCYGKQRHTMESAHEEAATKPESLNIRPYQCKHCQHWHIGRKQ